MVRRYSVAGRVIGLMLLVSLAWARMGAGVTSAGGIPHFSVYGRVTDSDGSAVANVLVQASPSSPYGTDFATTDSNGSYQMLLQGRRTYQLTFDPTHATPSYLFPSSGLTI